MTWTEEDRRKMLDAGRRQQQQATSRIEIKVSFDIPKGGMNTDLVQALISAFNNLGLKDVEIVF